MYDCWCYNIFLFKNKNKSQQTITNVMHSHPPTPSLCKQFSHQALIDVLLLPHFVVVIVAAVANNINCIACSLQDYYNNNDHHYNDDNDDDYGNK